VAIAAIGARRLVNRQQEEVIEYLVTENRVLRKKLEVER